MHRLLRGWGLALALAGCNPSAVTPDDPLYPTAFGDEEASSEAGAREAGGPRTFYLAVPLSGPRFRHPNAFGAGLVLPAGLEVEIDGLERGSRTGRPPLAWEATHPRSRTWASRVYRIRFHARRGACAGGCEAHWRAVDDDDFAQRFRKVFVPSDPLRRVGAEVRALVEAHRVAAYFDPATVRLSLGLPNTLVESGGATRWVYERRFCQGYGLVAVPSLALNFERGALRGYERLSPDGFYRPFEPVDPQAGLCTPAAFAPEQLVGIAGSDAYLSPLERQHAARRPVHRLTDALEGGVSAWVAGRRPNIKDGRSFHMGHHED